MNNALTMAISTSALYIRGHPCGSLSIENYSRMAPVRQASTMGYQMGWYSM
jgi:hypothetical protein